MKVLGIVCSPRRRGNTHIMMEVALAGAESAGAETELWSVVGKDIKPCDACERCVRKGSCHIEDGIQELYDKVLAADGLIFGCPSYFGSVTAQAKIVIDRLYALYQQSALAGKVGGVISVASASGHDTIRQLFNTFFQNVHILPADYARGFASDKGDVKNDPFAMRSSEELGRQVVALIKQQFRWPEEYIKPIYKVVKDKYGVEGCPLSWTRANKEVPSAK
ncbi:MAG: flavodoxin family protein [Chloroflexi bacterium]|nr:flavodoxin family protein [Chloroflexota bacterium]